VNDPAADSGRQCTQTLLTALHHCRSAATDGRSRHQCALVDRCFACPSDAPGSP
jgi:hypothetical protein